MRLSRISSRRMRKRAAVATRAFPTLRKASTGPEVERWQTFLRGLGLYKLAVDGVFGAGTEEATRALQRRANREGHSLLVDGIAGNQTIGYAMTLGFVVVEDPNDTDQNGPNWPPAPADLESLTDAQRDKAFGHIEWQPAPTSQNPEAIRITNDWVEEHIVTVTVPQLVGIQGATKTGRVSVHEIVRDPIVHLFQTWEDEGLLPKLLSWAGCWAPRLIRGSRDRLSNHAYGTAFDINAPWNSLGARPALLQEKGSVRALVPIANDQGWYWGGHYEGRKDGMHFEWVGR